MARIRVHAFSISLDGYGAGPDQSAETPLGVGGEELHEWMFPTRTFQRMIGNEGGTTGLEDELTRRGFENVGAWIMGRNLFAPSRGPWPDDGWKGWWGDDPPYHAPVFVLTHHPRASIEMEGGTTFHFVTDGAQAALQRAVEAAGGRDVRIVGMHFAIAPRLLGSGEHLLGGINTSALGYQVAEHVPTAAATHVVLTKRG